MRILIIGGTGFIGQDVYKFLSELGHEIILFNRGAPKPVGPSCVAHIIGDLRRFYDFKNTIIGLKPDLALEDMFHFSSMDAQLIINTLRGVIKRIIAISGTDVYRAYGRLFGLEHGPIETGPLTENSPLRQNIFPGMNGYDKLVVEQAIMSNPNIPGTILRLPPVYGPRSQMHKIYFYLKRMDDKRPYILMSRNLASWQWTHGYVENIAAAVGMAVTDERAAGRIYNLGEKEPVTMAEWIANIGKAVGWEGRIAIVPHSRFIEVTTFAMMRINTLQDIVVDSGLIRKELGFEEQVSNEEALDRTIQWERKNPVPPFFLDPSLFDYEVEDTILSAIKQENDSLH